MSSSKKFVKKSALSTQCMNTPLNRLETSKRKRRPSVGNFDAVSTPLPKYGTSNQSAYARNATTLSKTGRVLMKRSRSDENNNARNTKNSLQKENCGLNSGDVFATTNKSDNCLVATPFNAIKHTNKVSDDVHDSIEKIDVSSTAEPSIIFSELSHLCKQNLNKPLAKKDVSKLYKLMSDCRSANVKMDEEFKNRISDIDFCKSNSRDRERINHSSPAKREDEQRLKASGENQLPLNLRLEEIKQQCLSKNLPELPGAIERLVNGFRVEIRALFFERAVFVQQQREHVNSITKSHECELQTMASEAELSHSKFAKQTAAMQQQLLAGMQKAVERVNTLKAELISVKTENARLVALNTDKKTTKYNIEKCDIEVAKNCSNKKESRIFPCSQKENKTNDLDVVVQVDTLVDNPNPNTLVDKTNSTGDEYDNDSTDEHSSDCECSECV